MKAFRWRLLLSVGALIFVAGAARAGTLRGTVINRTTGKPVANLDLTLLNPSRGMVEIATTKTDPSGQFAVTGDEIGSAPILIRATYRDVSFNTFAPPGRPEVEVEIFETSPEFKTVSVSSHVVIFQPRGDKLLGAEEYTVDNASQPPVAYFRPSGNFDFAIPPEATLGQVTTTTSTGMSVNQASLDRGRGRYAIAFAFRPGQTAVRLSYDLPYPNNRASFNLPVTYGGSNLLVVVPPGVSLTGEGLRAAGQEQGMLVYTHAPVPAKTALSISVAGVGEPVEASGEGAGQEMPEEGNSRTEGPEVIAAPARINDLKWILLGGLASLFAMGALLLSRKTVLVASSSSGADLEVPGGRTAVSAPSGEQPKTDAQSLDEKEAEASVAKLKDLLFHLEENRQSGTLPEKDYAREKARLEKLLRDLPRS